MCMWHGYVVASGLHTLCHSDHKPLLRQCCGDAVAIFCLVILGLIFESDHSFVRVGVVLHQAVSRSRWEGSRT